MALMLLVLGECTIAEDADGLYGVWYGYSTFGNEMCFDFQEKGICYKLNLHSDNKKKGKWTMEDQLISARIGSETFYFRIKDDRLILDSCGTMLAFDDAILTREPIEVYMPAKKAKVQTKEEYDGMWKLKYFHFDIDNSYSELAHRQEVYGSFWSVNPSRDSGIYYIRINTVENSIALLNKQRETLTTHTAKWNNGCVTDKQWNYHCYLLEDGYLWVNDPGWSSKYFVKTDETSDLPET